MSKAGCVGYRGRRFAFARVKRNEEELTMPIPGSVAVPSGGLTAAEIIQLASDPAKYAKIVAAMSETSSGPEVRPEHAGAADGSPIVGGAISLASKSPVAASDVI